MQPFVSWTKLYTTLYVAKLSLGLSSWKRSEKADFCCFLEQNHSSQFSNIYTYSDWMFAVYVAEKALETKVWASPRSNKSSHTYPLGSTLFIPLLVSRPYCELRPVVYNQGGMWDFPQSDTHTVVTFHCMEPGSSLRDYFDVPYLSLSALNAKWQQITVLGKAEGI